MKWPRPKTAFALLPVQALCALLLVACSPVGALVPGAPPGAPDDIRALTDAARRGDKAAQLELGIRYEEGDGVVADLARARRLYGLAAADSPGSTWIYTPGKAGERGRMTQVSTGPATDGLAEAKRRLQRLDERQARP